MANAKQSTTVAVSIAGFTPEQWKQHMDTDEDWTERLDGVGEAAVREVLVALQHAEADVRALACNLVYAIGIDGLGGHANEAVELLAKLVAGESKAKVKARARMVHDSMAEELSRVTIRREMPWLASYAAAALPAAIGALADERPAVRLQVYVWLSNAGAIGAEHRAVLVGRLEAAVGRETDAISKRAAELALERARQA